MWYHRGSLVGLSSVSIGFEDAVQSARLTKFAIEMNVTMNNSFLTAGPLRHGEHSQFDRIYLLQLICLSRIAPQNQRLLFCIAFLLCFQPSLSPHLEI